MSVFSFYFVTSYVFLECFSFWGAVTSFVEMTSSHPAHKAFLGATRNHFQVMPGSCSMQLAFVGLRTPPEVTSANNKWLPVASGRCSGILGGQQNGLQAWHNPEMGSRSSQKGFVKHWVTTHQWLQPTIWEMQIYITMHSTCTHRRFKSWNWYKMQL